MYTQLPEISQSESVGLSRELDTELGKSLDFQSKIDCQSTEESVADQDLVAAYAAAKQSGQEALKGYFHRRFVLQRNQAIGDCIAGAKSVSAAVERLRALESSLMPLPSNIALELVEGMRPLVKEISLARQKESPDWDRIASDRSCAELGKSGAMERWLCSQLQEQGALSLEIKAWVERSEERILQLDLHDQTVLDDASVAWLLAANPALEELRLDGCFRVSAAAFDSGHSELRYLSLDDTGVDGLSERQRRCFPRLETCVYQHSVKRIRTLEHSPALERVLKGENAQARILQSFAEGSKLLEVNPETIHALIKRTSLLVFERQAFCGHIEMLSAIACSARDPELAVAISKYFTTQMLDLLFRDQNSSHQLRTLVKVGMRGIEQLRGERQNECWSLLAENLIHCLSQVSQPSPTRHFQLMVTSTLEAMAKNLVGFEAVDLGREDSTWDRLLLTYIYLVDRVMSALPDSPYLSRESKALIWTLQLSIYQLLKNPNLDLEYREDYLENYLRTLENPEIRPPCKKKRTWAEIIGDPTSDQCRTGGPYSQPLMDLTQAIALAQKGLPNNLRERLLRHLLNVGRRKGGVGTPNMYLSATGRVRPEDLPRNFEKIPLMSSMLSAGSLFEEEIDPDIQDAFIRQIYDADFGRNERSYVTALASIRAEPEVSYRWKLQLASKLDRIGAWTRGLKPGKSRKLYRAVKKEPLRTSSH